MKLQNRKIAILATSGFEESELTSPLKALKDEGGSVHVISPNGQAIKSWANGNWGREFEVDKSLNDVSASDYDALMLPGGVINPDQLRRNDKAIKFIQGFFTDKKQKPVAAICHGPITLTDANVLKDRKVTSYDSIRTDLKNAGAKWVDEEVVVDQGLVTSRSPKDLDAFNSKMVEEFCEGKHTI